MPTLKQLEEQHGSLIGKKVNLVGGSNNGIEYFTIEFKLSNGYFAVVNKQGAAICIANSAYDGYELVEDPKPRLYLWIYKYDANGAWYEDGIWLTEEAAKEKFANTIHSFRISPLCPEGVEDT
jgi:hypothetical protein